MSAPERVTASSQTVSLKQEWDEKGFVGPLTIFEPEEAKHLINLYDSYRAQSKAHFGKEAFIKPHLLDMKLAEIAINPKILDPVREILGDNILLWSTSFFIKAAHSGKRVGLHQDSHDWGLRPSTNIVSAWLAFTPSTTQSGAVRFAPGTHKLGMIDHKHTFSPDNMLSLGQEVDYDIDLGAMQVVELQPGQMSLHHGDVIHGGAPNEADFDRIGYLLNYIAADTEQLKGKDSATVVSGIYDGPFNQENMPKGSFTQANIEEFRQALEYPSGFNDMVLR